jgi:hypothetical protein
VPAPAIQDELLNEKISSLYDFSHFNKIVDVGGGHGGLIISILKANPQAFGVLVDAEEVIAGARTKLEAVGIADRCATIAGDLFQSVPCGGDAYILNRNIHDWDDERAIRILKNCGARKPQRVIIVDCKERTAKEVDELLAAAGLRFLRVIPTDLRTSIIEAEPR